MAVPIAALLAVLAGGLLVSKSRSQRPNQRRCTPEAYFGTVSFLDGGYPRAAEKRLQEWFKEPGAARYAAMSSGIAKEHQTLQNALTEGGEWEEIDSAIRGLEGPRTKKAWQIADGFLKAHGCPIKEAPAYDLKAILNDKEAWLRWVLAMGAYAGMKNISEASPDEQASQALWDAKEFIDSHFFALHMAANPGPFESGADAEIQKYAELLNALSRPIAGKLQKYDSKLNDMTPATAEWLFATLPSGEPFLVIEDRLVKLQKDFSIFMTGAYTPHEEGSSLAGIAEVHLSSMSAMTQWFPRYMGMDVPKTSVGWSFLREYVGQALNTHEPIAVPFSESFAVFSEVPDLDMPPVMVRGTLDADWWSDMGPKIKHCLAEGNSLEEVAVAILAGRGRDDTLCGSTIQGLETYYPSYDRWWQDHPGSDYEDYTKDLDAFLSRYPAVYLAVHNLMSMIAQKYPQETGSMGFGG
jgi:hypothetical protein